jgi:hypothetical protein
MVRYYRSALDTAGVVLVVCFLLTTLLFSWVNHRPEWMPALMCVGMIGCRYAIGRTNTRLCLYAFELLIVSLYMGKVHGREQVVI